MSWWDDFKSWLQNVSYDIADNIHSRRRRKAEPHQQEEVETHQRWKEERKAGLFLDEFMKENPGSTYADARNAAQQDGHKFSPGCWQRAQEIHQAIREDEALRFLRDFVDQNPHCAYADAHDAAEESGYEVSAVLWAKVAGQLTPTAQPQGDVGHATETQDPWSEEDADDVAADEDPDFENEFEDEPPDVAKVGPPKQRSLPVISPGGFFGRELYCAYTQSFYCALATPAHVAHKLDALASTFIRVCGEEASSDVLGWHKKRPKPGTSYAFCLRQKLKAFITGPFGPRHVYVVLELKREHNRIHGFVEGQYEHVEQDQHPKQIHVKDAKLQKLLAHLLDATWARLERARADDQVDLPPPQRS